MWQFDGQCWRTRLQLSADGGSVPSCASVAEPLKLIRSPTFHVSADVGAEMTGTGGLLPTLMTWLAVPVAEPASVTRSPVVTLPGLWYVQDAVTPVASSYRPSPSRSHAYVSAVPSGSEEPPPLNCTVSGAGPLVGAAWMTAVGGWLAPVAVIRRIVPPSKST